MKPLLFLLVVAALCNFSGCETPTQTYVKQHPGLSARQREILLSGRVPSGDAVAGMSREEIRIAMGSDPTQFTSINGEDAWVYVQERGPGPVPLSDYPASGSPRIGGSGGFSTPQGNDPQPAPVEVRTTIFFQGNSATRANVSETRP